ncbi:MAG: DUF1998 domain-containing protein [Gammaproteobacteria bacterium]|nr:DUF1998 domain-containing protein [Gammaproteobacteria bacterium]
MTSATIRQSQVITTYGPGALLDLPEHAAIVGGLEIWPHPNKLEQIDEARLSEVIHRVTGVAAPRLFAPPPAPSVPWEQRQDIGAWRFPEWFVVQFVEWEGRAQKRRLVRRTALENGKFEGKAVVPTRFVRACTRGHVDDLDWYGFVHRGNDPCRRELWLVEQGTSGDLSDLSVRCACGKQRSLYEAKQLESKALGTCRGARPWLGKDAEEDCDLPSRLLIRTATNAYFPQVVSVLSLPNRGSDVDRVVTELWDVLQGVSSKANVGVFKQLPRIAQGLDGYDDEEVFNAVMRHKDGGTGDRNLKAVELDALLKAKEGFGDDVPVDPNFHARRLPDHVWRTPGLSLSENIACVIQLHRLREVMALIGFTRLEAEMRDIHGEYDTDVKRADIAIEPSWFPAVENRGEGLFIQLSGEAVDKWLEKPPVQRRIDGLRRGHAAWQKERNSGRQDFPGGAYILLHTLAHLLLQSLAMRCGYPASSIRERIYAEDERYGILLYTATPDAEGTLGGLVQQARHIEGHLADALRAAMLCSNDPVCAQHEPDSSMERRWLHGAACHGCALIAETSCEMRNDHLDRALVVPTLAVADASFFPAPV